jgi:hypothetical protein
MKMLASTVQFSSYGRKTAEVTRLRSRSLRTQQRAGRRSAPVTGQRAVVDVPPNEQPPWTVAHDVALDTDRSRCRDDRAWMLLRKEVIQPHLPVRLPCYDFVPIASPTFDGSLHEGWATGFGCYRLS